MTVHLVNLSHLSFGVGVIPPRWRFALSGATPVVGIGIHTGNALRGYEVGTLARGITESVLWWVPRR